MRATTKECVVVNVVREADNGAYKSGRGDVVKGL